MDLAYTPDWRLCQQKEDYFQVNFTNHTEKPNHLLDSLHTVSVKMLVEQVSIWQLPVWWAAGAGDVIAGFQGQESGYSEVGVREM